MTSNADLNAIFATFVIIIALIPFSLFIVNNLYRFFYFLNDEFDYVLNDTTEEVI